MWGLRARTCTDRSACHPPVRRSDPKKFTWRTRRTGRSRSDRQGNKLGVEAKNLRCTEIQLVTKCLKMQALSCPFSITFFPCSSHGKWTVFMKLIFIWRPIFQSYRKSQCHPVYYAAQEDIFRYDRHCFPT